MLEPGLVLEPDHLHIHLNHALRHERLGLDVDRVLERLVRARARARARVSYGVVWGSEFRVYYSQGTGKPAGIAL